MMGASPACTYDAAGDGGGRNHGMKAWKELSLEDEKKEGLKKSLLRNKFHVSSHLLEPRPFTDSGRGIFYSCVAGSG